MYITGNITFAKEPGRQSFRGNMNSDI